jgi:hypothetical protein
VGYEIEATSLYGIRVYRQGSVLATHVDRLPLVSSCIIQVSPIGLLCMMLINVYHHIAPHHITSPSHPHHTIPLTQIAQDVKEPWPIEVYAHDGKGYNVTMEPGEMVSLKIKYGKGGIIIGYILQGLHPFYHLTFINAVSS